ncbi:MAG: hypothetical protein F6K31_17450 [Symploca sp. SIO2G7]|nr:hypothetical protein [Symploca sp. SIO2G7]
MGTAIGLGIGVIIGQNWNRIKKGLTWLGERFDEEIKEAAKLEEQEKMFLVPLITNYWC